MVFIGFYVIFDEFINGPWSISAFEFMPQDSTPCKKYWWRNLLYINNFFSQLDVCYGITWYLSVDTQLYFVAPVFLITLFISPIAGFALIVACIVGSIAFVYAVTIQNSFPAMMMGAALDMNVLMDFFTDYYVKPWARCPPYLIGIAVGYFLAMKKKPKLNKVIVVCLWIVAAAVALASLYGPHRYIKGAADWR
ncbi:hypothetical protein OESDEN_19326 [Oesophagostomum dentatum]|uniref:Acyltransferase 3 domain-containing protein n=1 Tax=Oesophagostomum dentatum TaxID=61180 RepID=A0A0B1SBR6_OESDE|nr:hypothetical protein OESDEN_19326 [Oesophagostomum dentatum]